MAANPLDASQGLSHTNALQQHLPHPSSNRGCFPKGMSVRSAINLRQLLGGDMQNCTWKKWDEIVAVNSPPPRTFWF